MENLRINEKDLKFVDIDGGGIPIYNYKGKPFTGILLEYYNNELYKELGYVDGYQDGIERVFYEDNKIKHEYYLKNNLLHGICKNWDIEGNLVSESLWENGNLVKRIV